MKIVLMLRGKVFKTIYLFLLVLSSVLYSAEIPQTEQVNCDDSNNLLPLQENTQSLVKESQKTDDSQFNKDVLQANSQKIDEFIEKLKGFQDGSNEGVSQGEQTIDDIVNQLSVLLAKLKIKQINVLSLDGGGARGYSEALVLCILTRILNKPIHEIFNNIVATSTGAIMAAAFGTVKRVELDNPDFGPIAEGSPLSILKQPAPKSIYFTPDDVMSFYFKESKEIFSGRGISGSTIPYPDEKLNGLLQKYFSLNQTNADGKKEAGKELNLSQLAISTSFMVYNDNLGEVILYSTRKALKDPKYNKELWEVVRTAVAAPCYFKPVTYLDSQFAMGDAGIVANNPVWWGINEAAKEHDILPHECIIFSLGGGRLCESKGAEYYIKLSASNFGVWGENMLMNFVLNRAFDGFARHKEIKKSMKRYYKDNWQNHYFRFDPLLVEHLFHTDKSSVEFFDGLRSATYEQIEESIPELGRFAKVLNRGKQLEVVPQTTVNSPVEANTNKEKSDVDVIQEISFDEL